MGLLPTEFLIRSATFKIAGRELPSDKRKKKRRNTFQDKRLPPAGRRYGNAATLSAEPAGCFFHMFAGERWPVVALQGVLITSLQELNSDGQEGTVVQPPG